MLVCSMLCLLQASSNGTSEVDPSGRCHGCCMDLTAAGQNDQEPGVVLQCPSCRHLFCFDCDVYIHESLHNCPGCECSNQKDEHDDMHDDL